MSALSHSDKLRLLQSTPMSDSPTSCISIITPPMQKADLKTFVIKELATARNIKSNTNRKSVMTGLSKVSTYLDSIRQIPANGLAIFAGSLV